MSLDEQATSRSAQAVHAAMRQQAESIGLATVYRTLQMMVEDDEVDVLYSEDGEQSFRRCGGTHHHLVCRVCGETVEVHDHAVARWAREIADKHKFVDKEHQVDAFGTCSACHRSTSPRRMRGWESLPPSTSVRRRRRQRQRSTADGP